MLCLNLFMMMPPLFPGTKKDVRIRQLLDRAAEFDVLCLQEVWSAYSRRVDVFIRDAADRGFCYHARSGAPRLSQLKLLDGGLLILSRFPIDSSEFVAYSTSAHADMVASKGALYAQLRLGDRSLHIFNTHMQAFYAMVDPKATAAKAIQLQELARFVLRRASSDKEPVLLCGGETLPSHRPTGHNLRTAPPLFPIFTT